jgi:hypothetical protein
MGGLLRSPLTSLLLAIAVDQLQAETIIRLSGGSSSSSGRVEIQTDAYQWSPLCDYDWSIDEANVVCRQLHYDRAAIARRGLFLGSGTGPVVTTNYNCDGDETDLSECRTGSRWLVTTCDDNEFVGVTCENGRSDQESEDPYDNEGTGTTVNVTTVVSIVVCVFGFAIALVCCCGCIICCGKS